MKNIFFIAVFFCIQSYCQAQTNAEKAIEKATAAMVLEDEGKYQEALTLLLEAEKLDNKNIDITYEKGYCYYIQGDYKNAIAIIEKAINNTKATDQFYQLLGNSYDNEFNHKKALEIYKAGIEKFPNSGKLYTETGVLYIGQKDLSKALNYFEKGIQVDPYYPSNYYHAAKLFCASDNEIWGLLYGEIFMNMERGSKRTLEMSKLLYDTYKQGFEYTNEKLSGVSLCKDAVIRAPNKGGTIKLPYGNMILESSLAIAAAGTSQINIASLNSIRNIFLANYNEKFNKDYPNILFTYHQQLADAKVFEAYNYWLFNQGNEAEMKTWADAHKEEFALFLTWFKKYPIIISEANHFHRMDY